MAISMFAMWANSASVFSDTTSSFGLDSSFTSALGSPCSHRGTLTFADYNNDGRPDLMYTGDATFCGAQCKPTTKLYENVPTFLWKETTDTIFAAVPGVADSSVVWGDFNNDNNQDMLMCGNSAFSGRSPAPVLTLYRNPGSSAAFVAETLPSSVGLYQCSVAFINCDSDAFLEVLATGLGSDGSRRFFLYDVDCSSGAAACSFTSIGDSAHFPGANTLPVGVSESGIAVGDFDQDGNSDDFFMTGYDGATGLARSFLNSGSCTFANSSAVFPIAGWRHAAVAVSPTFFGLGTTMVVTGSQGSGTCNYRSASSTDLKIYTWTGGNITSSVTLPSGTVNFCKGAVSIKQTSATTLSIALSGLTSSGATGYKVVRYSSTSSSVDETLTVDSVNMLSMYQSSAAILDFNLDGSRDLAIAGSLGDFSSTTASPATLGFLPPSIGGSLLLMPGSAGASPNSQAMTDQTDRLLPTYPTSMDNVAMDVADYSANVSQTTGCPDIMVTGTVKYLATSKLYRSVSNTPPCSYQMSDVAKSAFVVPVQNYLRGTVNFIDFNKDGYMDLMLSGLSFLPNNSLFTSPSFSRSAKIYKNGDGNAFIEEAVSLPGYEFGVVAWGNYDNDDYLDFLYTGATASSIGFVLMRGNFTGSYTWSDVGPTLLPGFTGVHRGSAAWGDVDKDGKQDLLITGSPTAPTYTAQTILYKGTGATTAFTDVTSTFLSMVPPLWRSRVEFFDFDGTGGTDLFVTGSRTPAGDGTLTAVTMLLINPTPGSALVDSTATFFPGLTAVMDAAFVWKDYDGDGNVDLLLTGSPEGYNGMTKLYRNPGGGAAFVDVTAESLPANIPGQMMGGVAMADFDGDANLDIAMFGRQSCTPMVALTQSISTATTTAMVSSVSPAAAIAGTWCLSDALF